ncbi:MAG: SRPBCC family protein [Terriglobia bacterium]
MQQSVIHSTFVLERSFLKTPEQVFAAFADPALKRRWFSDSDTHDVEKFTLDFRVGGAEQLAYRFREGTPFSGAVLVSEGIHLDIVPNQRIVSASTMAVNGSRISASLVTCEFLATDSGTDLICAHQGAFFEGSDGPEIREAGWRSLLEKLAKQLSS